MNGKLEVNSFSTFMSSCFISLPALSASDYQKHSSFILSVIHKVDINDQQQEIQIDLGADDPAKHLLTQITGKQPRQRTIIEIAKGDIPSVAAGMFQPLFKFYSGVAAGGTAQGWQIESIAVNGNL